MFSFFVSCGWGVQEGDPWHPRSVRPFPVSGWPTPCRGQEIRWTGSPLTLPKVLPLTFLFTCSWRSIKSISLMEHFKLFLLFFFLLLFHWFWTCYSIVHYGKSNLGIVSVVCTLESIGPNRQGFPKYSFTRPQESYALLSWNTFRIIPIWVLSKPETNVYALTNPRNYSFLRKLHARIVFAVFKMSKKWLTQDYGTCEHWVRGACLSRHGRGDGDTERTSIQKWATISQPNCVPKKLRLTCLTFRRTLALTYRWVLKKGWWIICHRCSRSRHRKTFGSIRHWLILAIYII